MLFLFSFFWQIIHTSINQCGTEIYEYLCFCIVSYLPGIPALGSNLVELGLCNVSPLLCLLQVMLHLSALSQGGVGLLSLEQHHQTIIQEVIGH